MKNQVFSANAFNFNCLAVLFSLTAMLVVPSALLAQSSSTQSSVSLKQVQWKSEQQVRDLMGEPISIKGPVGTHATYTLWEYPDVTIAFANKRAFHLFRKDSLRKLQLDENRPSGG